MTTMTSKGQATIPQQVREYLGLKPGDEIEFVIIAGHVEIKRVKKARAYDLGKDVIGHWHSGEKNLSTRSTRKAIAAEVMRAKRG